MTTYVALLRGINVGGKNKIDMGALCAAFEKMGFPRARTFINSGNVLFTSNLTDRGKIERAIEKSLSAAFDYEARVLVRSRDDIARTISDFPAVFASPDWKHNVIFLSDAINKPSLLDRYALREGNEVNSYSDGVLYWSARLDAGTRAVMYKLSAQPEYQEMTVRSVGTVKKILGLMDEDKQ